MSIDMTTLFLFNFVDFMLVCPNNVGLFMYVHFLYLDKNLLGLRHTHERIKIPFKKMNE